MSGDGGSGGHCRADEMSTSATPLPSLKVPIACRGTALFLFEHVTVHSDTHATTCFTPLKTGFAEDIGESLLFGRTPHPHGARHNHRTHIGRDMLALHVLSGHAQVFQPRIRAGTDKDTV